jgi:hypothetical protein
MNKPLTGLFCFLHTIKHINKSGLASIGLVGAVEMPALKKLHREWLAKSSQT